MKSQISLIISISVFTTLFISCQRPIIKQLQNQTYRAGIEAQDNKVISFVFKVTSPTTLEIYNAEEVIEVDEISYQNDSVIIQLPVFQSTIVAKISNNNELNGYYTRVGLNSKVPFSATMDTKRFDVSTDPQYDISGNWEVVFSPDNLENSSTAKGIFKQEGHKVTGTFRTLTGDYRYLEGVMDGDQLKLSTFDGAHAFLFTARVSDSTMTGTFYSRNSWKESFLAKRNEHFELPSEESLTWLKEGYDWFEFSFPDEHGQMVSLKDDQFKNKVVVVQIMGTWCPNCLDETRYFVEYYQSNKDKPVAFVALACEYVSSEEQAFSAIKRLKETVGVGYPVLLAQYGSSSKTKLLEKFPMLNQVLAYPTSIIMDKQGKVRQIHTGFNGPATGDKYTTYKRNFETLMDLLIEE